MEPTGVQMETISLFDNSIGELAPTTIRHIQLGQPQFAPPMAVFDLGKIAESARSSTSSTSTRAAGAKRDFCFSLSKGTVSKLHLAQAGSDQAGGPEITCTPRGTPLYTPRGTATGAYEEFAMPTTANQPASGVL